MSMVTGRAARMTGLKKPRPLKKVSSSSQISDLPVPDGRPEEGRPEKELMGEMERFSLIQLRAQEFVKAAQRFEEELPLTVDVPTADQTVPTLRRMSSDGYHSGSSSPTDAPRSNSPPRVHHPTRPLTPDPSEEPGSSYTAVILLPGLAGTEEKLVLASTSMTHILEASRILAQHMTGDVVYIDPVCNNVQAGAHGLPHLYRPASTLTSQSGLSYSVKDLLMMSKMAAARQAPRNWYLIKQTFPELVSHEDHYFEPFDLKACSPEALGRPTTSGNLNEKPYVTKPSFGVAET